MTSFRKAVLPLFLVAANGFLPGLSPTVRAEFHRHRTCTKCSAPKHSYGYDNQRSSVKAFAVADSVVTVGNLTRKPFHYRDVNLTLEHLNLNQVGLAIDKETGTVTASGRVTHNGGDGGLIGSHVTFRVRAYVSANNTVVQLPPDSVMVWESVHKVWVPRGQKVISLVPAPENQSRFASIQTNFNAITHLELEMELHHDR